MTIIVTDSGTRWVEIPPRKRRKPGRALRFAEIKVSDQLMLRHATYQGRQGTWYYVVCDVWFDPVAGQKDEIAGQMVALQRISPRTGDIEPHKYGHTKRGLASQGYHYADMDYQEHIKASLRGVADGAVVDIGYGQVIRKRPKMTAPRF
jgi:hypothetical protein